MLFFAEFFLEFLVLATLCGNALSTFCHICDYTKADSCQDHTEYQLVDCQKFWPESKYCLKFNGTRRAVRQDGGEVTAGGVHRACQQEIDLETYGLRDLQTGCRNLHVFNKNTTLYKSFVFDGTMCLCDETGCNTGSHLSADWQHNHWVQLLTFFFTGLILH